MSVAGFDVGNCTSCVALARKRGVDVLMNSESKRETPALVSFGDKMRFVGVNGAARLMMNVNNTVGQVKRLVGAKFKDPVVQRDIKEFMYKVEEGPDGGCLINVMYLNEPRKFSPEQIVAVLLKDLKRIAEEDQGSTVTDCCIACPVFFTEAQRYAMLSAAGLAGLKCLRLMNEPTATALAYGIFKTDLPEETPVNVAFVDVGNASMQVSIVAFRKGRMEVKAHTWDRSLGGRDLDQVLVSHFSKEFQEKTGIDITGNMKSHFRISTAAERCRQMLTVNPEAPFAVESLAEDTDFRSNMTRELFERLAADVLERVQLPCKRALEVAGISAADLGSVEMVGAASRTPSIVASVQQAFGLEPKRTMNSKECVSTGCALQCAMLSPVFRVREFDVKDCYPFKVELTYEKDNATVTSPIFGAKDGVPQLFPNSKSIKFCKSEPFKVNLAYSADSDISEAQPRDIAVINVDGFEVKEHHLNPAVTVHLHLNLHGIVECTKVVRNHQEEYEVPAETAAPAAGAADAAAAAPDAADAPMDTSEPGEVPKADGAAPADAAAVTVKKTKKVSEEGKFAMTAFNKMPAATFDRLLEAEGHMAAQDHLQEATNEAKNALEGYVYAMRSKLFDQYAPFVREDVRSGLSSELDGVENWLYEDGEDESKSTYESKLASLKEKCEPIASRYTEASTREPAGRALQAVCNRYLDFADSTDPKYAHIEAGERERVRTECNDALSWLADKSAMQGKLAKTDEPAVLTADIVRKQGVLERVCEPVASKPAPKKEEPKPEPAPAPAAAADAGAADAAPMEEDTAAPAAEGAPPGPEIAPMDE